MTGARSPIGDLVSFTPVPTCTPFGVVAARMITAVSPMRRCVQHGTVPLSNSEDFKHRKKSLSPGDPAI